MEFTKEDYRRIEREEEIREAARERIKAKRERPGKIVKLVLVIIAAYFVVHLIRAAQYASYDPFSGIVGR